MYRPREKYNAKARRSTAGASSSKKKSRNSNMSAEISDTALDPNEAVMVAKTKEQKEAEKRERLRQELAIQSESKMTGKRKKRLDKYIDKKLKQEDRVVILQKLAESQAQSSSLNLQSSSTLGTGKTRSNKERLDRLEDKEVRRAIDGRTGRRNRAQATIADDNDSDDALDEDATMQKGPPSHGPAQTDDRELPKMLLVAPVVVADCSSTFADTRTAVTQSLAVGSALKRNSDGSVVAPRIVKRPAKGGKSSFRSWASSPRRISQDEPQSDSSFDSSDSAYDHSDEDDNEGASSDSSSDEADLDDTVSHDSPAVQEPPAASEAPAEPAMFLSERGGRKPLGFKDWALKQLGASKGYAAADEPQAASSSELSGPPPPKRRKLEPAASSREMRGPLGEELRLPQTALSAELQNRTSARSPSAPAKAKTVLVARPPEVESARLLLPVVTEEQPIMEAILLNPVVIICGETGSGKTTQVPQFLYEAGFGLSTSDNPGMIGVTQPRRVAAMSMAARVAHELSLTSSRVSYQIRYDATVSSATAIKFMTDGVLLRELATDFLLTKYSVIIIDEAHERSLNTDILIGVLSRVIKLREDLWKEKKDGAKPLRLIIMSATLRISDFAENKALFPSPPPVIHVPARQHPVTIHFNRRTPTDYVREAIRKASKIHARLPTGGILIFLTGQNEINGVCKALEEKYGRQAILEKKQSRKSVLQRAKERDDILNTSSDPAASVYSAQVDVEAEDLDLGAASTEDLAFDVDGDVDADSEALDSEDDGDDEELGIDAEESEVPMHIVPLYSLLPSDKQMKVFDPPPEGTRLVVVATNVAETSLTIPGIRYVVDCGRCKERRFDSASGIQTFQVSWVSKASASQRAGRAGRTGPGHCYRLFSSALYEHYFDQFAQPEILRVPVEGIVLQMKSMHIDTVTNFPFPTPPDRSSLQKAEIILTHLGALSTNTVSASSTKVGGAEITEVGRAMSLFPLSPRYSKMMVGGRRHGCLPYVIAIVSALSVGDPFLREAALENEDADDSNDEVEQELVHLTSDVVRAKEAKRIRRKAFFQSQHTHGALGDFTSDIFRILSVVGAYEFAGGGHSFCEEHFVRPKAMEEIHKLRSQISRITQSNFPALEAEFSPKLQPPSNLQLKVLRQLLASAFIDQVAVRKDVAQRSSASGAQYATSNGIAYVTLNTDEDVFIHPSSILASRPPPEYVIYIELVQTSRLWMKGVTVVNAAWLSTLGRPYLCTFSKPVKSKEGKLLVIPRFGPGWELPPILAESIV